MPELSQFVRQRLASRGATGDHPDADTLTAYVERLLPPAERSRVLDHIAGCSHCRDVVALSLPDAAETLPVPALTPPRRTWRWKPAMGLAAALASLAIVTGVILELPKRGDTFESANQFPATVNPANQDNLKAAPQSTPSASASAPAEESRAAEPHIAAPPSSSTVNGAIAGNSVAARREAFASPVSPGAGVSAGTSSASWASSNPVVADARLHQRDYVNSQMFLAAQSDADAVANPTAVPAAPLPGLTQNLPPPLSSNTQLAFADLPPQIENGKVLRSHQLSSPPSHPLGLGFFPNLPALGRKAEKEVESLAKRRVAISPGAMTFSAMESNTLKPSREDQVQNVDGQNTSDKAGAADLDRSSAFSQRALAGRNEAGYQYQAGSALAWRVSAGKLLKSGGAGLWVEGYSGESIEFTVVAARGSNIWAGGVNAALIHSVNGGASWERIELGASAAGSITGIDAAGANVHIFSSSGQEWSSQDGGKTWSLDK